VEFFKVPLNIFREKFKVWKASKYRIAKLFRQKSRLTETEQPAFPQARMPR
jgi:hypothetical protein